MPPWGCLILALALGLMCLMPLVLVDTLSTALSRLHLPPAVAALSVVGILLGGFINIPVWRRAGSAAQFVQWSPVWGPEPWVERWAPQIRRMQYGTLVAVNVGGCVIPCLLALWQVLHLVRVGGYPLGVLLLAVSLNVFVCYRVARPTTGLGILLPGWAAPLAALGATWILLGDPNYAAHRAPVAFTAGVLGPLVGADLLHLADVRRLPAAMLSIGGAGTFDGIVLSGVLAALLA